MENQSSLTSGMLNLPQDWRFVPINGNKQPLGRDWQNTPMTANDFIEAESTGSFSKLFYQPKGSETKKPVPFDRVEAIGILCGEPSGGQLCLDHDGHSCDPLIEKLSGQPLNEALPKTVGFHADKDGHYQSVYHIPSVYWGAIAHKRILTGVKVWNEFKQKNEDEQLDLRWNGAQSVIMGVHPETGSYRWMEGRSPAECEVAECPQWIIEQMLSTAEEPSQPESTPLTGFNKFQSTLSDREWALSYLEFIRADNLDWYGWRDIMLAMHKAGLSESEARSWSQASSKHTNKGFDDVWRYIDDKGRCIGIGTLGMIAKKNGWQRPQTDDRATHPRNYSDTIPGSPIKTTKEAIESVASQDSGYVALRLAIMDALVSRDPLEKELKLLRIASKHSVPNSYVQRTVRDITQRRETKKTEFNLRDMMNLGSKGVEWLIPRFVPKKGLTLLGGFAKDGKSTLTYELIASLLTGRPFLGEIPNRKARVLLIQLEENEDKIRQRLEGVGVLYDPEVMLSDSLHIKTVWSVDDIDRLEQWIIEHRIEYVFFDSLRACSRATGVDENSASFANPVYELQAFLNKMQIGGYMIHHFNKNKEAVSAEKFAGSSAIPGAADNLHLLIRESTDQDSPTRQLSMSGRDCGGRFKILYVEEEFPTFRFDLVQELNCDPEDKDLKKRILDLLQLNHQKGVASLSGREIQQGLGLPSDSKSIYKPLKKLVIDKALSVERDAKDQRVQRYSLPEFDTVADLVSSPPTPKLDSGYQSPATHAQQDFQAVSQIVSSLKPEEVDTNFEMERQQNQTANQSFSDVQGLVSTSSDATISNGGNTIEDTNSNPCSVTVLPDSYSKHGLQGGGVDTKPAIQDVGGYAKYRTDAPPHKKRLPYMFATEVEHDNGDVYRIGDRVWWNGQDRQIERIEISEEKTLCHLGNNQWADLAILSKTPPVLPAITGNQSADDQVSEWESEESLEDSVQMVRDVVSSNDPATAKAMQPVFALMSRTAKKAALDRLTQDELDALKRLLA